MYTTKHPREYLGINKTKLENICDEKRIFEIFGGQKQTTVGIFGDQNHHHFTIHHHNALLYKVSFGSISMDIIIG